MNSFIISNEIKRYQIRGVPGDVKRVEFSGRIVDYWLEATTHTA